MLMVMDRREAMEIDVASALVRALVATARRTIARAGLFMLRPLLVAALRNYTAAIRALSLEAIDPTGLPNAELERWASLWARRTGKFDGMIVEVESMAADEDMIAYVGRDVLDELLRALGAVREAAVDWRHAIYDELDERRQPPKPTGDPVPWEDARAELGL